MFEFYSDGTKVFVNSKTQLLAVFAPTYMSCLESTGKPHIYPATPWAEFKAWVLIKTGLDVEEYRPVWAN
jgi:hypothetical protein